MTMTRRQALWGGGGFLAVLSFSGAVRAGNMMKIVMKGNQDGSRVWFDPIGLHVNPGQTLQWTNLDAGNSHTATAYDPANFNRPRRIPNGAKALGLRLLAGAEGALPEAALAAFPSIEQIVRDGMVHYRA